MVLVVRTTITPLGTHSGNFSITLHGVTDSWIPSLQNVGDEWQRIGQAGSGVQIIGTRGQKVTISGWYGAQSLSDAKKYMSNFESLETEVCQVSDDWSRTIPRVRITSIKCALKTTRGPLIAPGNPVIYRVNSTFTAEQLATS